MKLHIIISYSCFILSATAQASNITTLPAAPNLPNPEPVAPVPVQQYIAPGIPPVDNTHYPLVSINTENPLDMNWIASMELGTGADDDTVMRPYSVVVPFFGQLPIENLEIKLRLLNVKF